MIERCGLRLSAWRSLRSGILGCGLLLSIAYCWYVYSTPDRPTTDLFKTGMFKLSPIACFSLAAILQAVLGIASATDVQDGPSSSSGMYSLMLGSGLMLSCLGDFALELQRSGREELFMVSMTRSGFYGAYVFSSDVIHRAHLLVNCSCESFFNRRRVWAFSSWHTYATW